MTSRPSTPRPSSPPSSTDVVDDGGEVVTLGGPSRIWRVGVLAAVTVLTLLGTTVGDDHWWPFSPWRMFSTSTPASGAVVVMSIEVRRADDPSRWVGASLTPESVGLNRAEIEGRIPQIVGDPERLGTLAASHAVLRPNDPAWLGVRVVRVENVLRDRSPTGEVRRKVIAQWNATGSP